MAMIQCATQVFAGENTRLPAGVQPKLIGLGLHDELIRGHGTYTVHYPFFIRRVLPEDTLISMASGTEEPYYSVSVFTYEAPGRREAYYAFCSWLARCMSGLFDARLHWGKHFPLGALHTARHYPRMETFRQLCAATDPRGVFRNAFIERAVGPAPAVRSMKAL